MNKQDEIKDDLLRYMNRGKIEVAPEGLTRKVMNSISMEPSFRKADVGPARIPLISAAVVALLIVASLLIPSNDSGMLSVKALTILKNLRSSLPDLNVSSLFRITLPSVITYVIVGIFVLTILDRALYRIFHRQ